MYTDDNNREVKPERTGWRDEALSRRHRLYGFDVPMLDIDFLVVEYAEGKVKALFEYKHRRAPVGSSGHPSYRALIDLADRGSLPLYVARYDEHYTFTVTALNEKATAYLNGKREVMPEDVFVNFLHVLRGHEAPKALLREIRALHRDEKGGAA